MGVKILYMGTPEFAVPSLRKLKSKDYDICGIITQPDRPRGRGKKLLSPPVKVAGEELGIKIYQPTKIKSPDFVDIIKNIGPDMIVVIAFGQLLSKEILEIPAYGCINVHASLLPQLRGAAPINWSIINGDDKTGITIMYMDEGMDTGDIIMQKEIEIEPEDTAESLHDRLAILGADTIIKAIDLIIEGKADRIAQNHSEATYAPLITKDTGRIDWSKNAKAIKNLIRGTYPWPSAYSYYNDSMFKVFQVDVIDGEENNNHWGVIDQVSKDSFIVKCGTGSLRIKEIQFQNKRRMSVEAYLRGHTIEKGKLLT